jgi:hypothetical protein
MLRDQQSICGSCCLCDAPWNQTLARRASVVQYLSVHGNHPAPSPDRRELRAYQNAGRSSLPGLRPIRIGIAWLAGETLADDGRNSLGGFAECATS